MTLGMTFENEIKSDVKSHVINNVLIEFENDVKFQD